MPLSNRCHIYSCYTLYRYTNPISLGGWQAFITYQHDRGTEAKSLIYTYRCIKKSGTRFMAGEHEVRIRISQLKEKEFISLGYSSSIKNWDEGYWLPKPSHPHYKSLLKKINKYLDDIAFEIKLADKDGRYISCLEVKRKVMHKDINLLQQRSQLKILEFFDNTMENVKIYFWQDMSNLLMK